MCRPWTRYHRQKADLPSACPLSRCVSLHILFKQHLVDESNSWIDDWSHSRGQCLPLPCCTIRKVRFTMPELDHEPKGICSPSISFPLPDESPLCQQALLKLSSQHSPFAMLTYPSCNRVCISMLQALLAPLVLAYGRSTRYRFGDPRAFRICRPRRLRCMMTKNSAQATNKEQSIRIQSSGGLTEQQIQQMVDEARVNEEKDKARKSGIEAKNEAETAVYRYGPPYPTHSFPHSPLLLCQITR